VNAEIGADGHAWTAELRPRPATDIEEFIQNIQILINRASEMAENHIFLAGSYIRGKRIGGHLHFSEEVKDYKKCVNDLSVLVGIPFLFIEIFIENTESARKRREEYGHFGEYRHQDWGFEWRTLSSWLVSPLFAYVAVSLSYAIVKNQPHIKIDYDEQEFSNNFNSANLAFFEKYLTKILEFDDNIMSIVYGKNSKIYSYWRSFISLIKLNKKWKENEDFKPKWIKCKYSIVFNFKDKFLKEIKDKFQNIKLNKQILVYGLKQSRGNVIFVKNLALNNEIIEIARGLGIEIKFESVGIGTDYQYSIGLGYDIRKKIIENDNIIIGFIKKLLEGGIK